MKRLGAYLLRKIIIFGGILGVILLIGYCASDHKDYPGRTQFEAANSQITTNTGGAAHGKNPACQEVAAQFAISMKKLQAAMFSGGSGRSFATGGDFVTYVEQSPKGFAILCHVPELRNYKSPESREALASIAWAAGKIAIAKHPLKNPSDTLIIGLRGFGSYGPIWEGTIDGNPTLKTDDLSEEKRLYPFFVP